MEEKDFDKLFRERLASREINPSEGLWNRLEAQLDQPKKRNWKRILPLAAILVLGLFVAGLQFFGEEKPSAKVVVEETTPSLQIQRENITESVKEEVKLEKVPEIVVSDKYSKPKSDQESVVEEKEMEQPKEPLAAEEKQLASIAKSDASQEDKSDVQVEDETTQLLQEAFAQMESRSSSQNMADASDLLKEVSAELELEANKDFRQKAEDFLKDKWQQTKSFLAQNNSK